MPTIETLANYAEIIGMLSLIGGIVWGVVQLRELRQQRSETAAIELVRSWQTPEFTKALRMVQTVPDGVDPDEFRAAHPQMEDMAFVVCLMFESTGVMVYRRIIPLYVVDDLMGGVIRVVWTKLGRRVLEWRNERNPRAFEWWEWLADRLDEHSELVDDRIAPKLHAEWRVDRKIWSRAQDRSSSRC